MRQNLIINQTFSKGIGNWYEPNYLPGCAEIVASPFRNDISPNTLKLTLNKQPNTLRSEIGTDPLTMPKEVWVGLPFCVDADYKPDSQDFSVTQMQAYPDQGETWGNPPLSFIVRGTQLICDIRADATKINPTKQLPVASSTHIGDIIPGQWLDLVYHVRWGFKNDGLLQIWVNNKRVVSSRMSIGYNDIVNPYFKFGIYQWNLPISNKDSKVVYFGPVRVGNEKAGYNDVYPGQVKSKVTTVTEYYDGSKSMVEKVY